MIRFLKRYSRIVSGTLVLVMLLEIGCPTVAWALTSGPSQPEATGFQPAGTSDMVDLFSGDFSYNIPLFELPGPNGGYPFNLAYQAGAGMDTEASWVGLGFAMNPGTINRQMRGLPDEFKGDVIHTKMALEPNSTFGLGAGASVEFFGGDKSTGVPLKGNVGVGITYNTFKGYGYAIESGLGYSGAANSGQTAGIGLNLKLDTQEGVSVSPNISLNGKMGNLELSAGYNSKTGMETISMSATAKAYKAEYTEGKLDKAKTKTKDNERGSRLVGSSTISLSHPGYTPQVSIPMKNTSISAKFAPGGEFWGVFGKAYIRGFYSTQRLKNNMMWTPTEGYGYLNLEHAADKRNAIQDFNREKDGIITKEGPNLPIPSLTYDVYSVTGQGISAMYRPFRNDQGVVYDPEVKSESVGGSVGIDAAPALSKVGVNLSVNHSRSVSSKWEENNAMDDKMSFQKKNVGDLYEPVTFKAHGESTSENLNRFKELGESRAVRVQLSGMNASGSLESGSWNSNPASAASSDRQRKSRNQVIQSFTNAELGSGQGELLSFFKVKYKNTTGHTVAYNRGSRPDHHIGAFTALTPEGLRYNYGIPAYNEVQEDAAFSVTPPAADATRVPVSDGGKGDPNFRAEGTDKYLKRTQLPAYAHSYLLTSIIGPDYVDVLGDGVTEDDLGYWVKFTYRQTADKSSLYKWRDPYTEAHHQEGWQTDPRDNKGSFIYGEKEIWYLSQAETKSHVATFSLGEREDGRGVFDKFQLSTQKTGKGVYKLSEMQLYARTSGPDNPIKIVKFDYDYSRCAGVYNSSTGGGKLTLKKVWFQYGKNNRGRFNPYEFSYSSFNPGYNQNAYDRWGNYKPAGPNKRNIYFPYSEQDPTRKSEYDQWASAWNLTEIKLPSGGKILVDYETDDYGYVQHLPAMQMTEAVFDHASVSPGNFILDDDAKIKFKLERPISSETTVNQRNEVLKYLDQRRKQLYFKARINLKRPGDNRFEYISGYADIDFSKEMTLERQAGATSGDYLYGTFYLAKERGGVHPFSMRTWQHIRANQPDMASGQKVLKSTDVISEQVSHIKSLTSAFIEIRKMFEGFYNYCKHEQYGREIKGGESWIRLNSPDKIKYGGGLRVRQITMLDNWADNDEGVYGQVYDYTTQEDGKTISSGVAAYEPLTGGDEIPLRYAKKFTQTVPLKSPNTMFFEFPVNESYYPGAQVGYSKVTVRSLAAAALEGNTAILHTDLANGKKVFPRKGKDVSFGTSGITVHEFYTARDFPVLTEETEKANKAEKLNVPIPFLGNVVVSNLTTSQGYSITTNDMHGKQKQVSTYQQDPQGKRVPEPVSWVKYNYVSESKVYEQQKVLSLSASFKDNQDGTLSLASREELANPAVAKFSIGQENEFFMDMREHQDNTWEGGVNLNLDVLYFLFVTVPIPIPWPSIGKNSQQLRTAVTNKIIYKSGILESTEAYDGGSRVITKNLQWDKQTGQVVLSQVNNNFDAPIYSYNVPAFTKYQGMGAAYQNIGLTFSISNVEKILQNGKIYSFTSGVAQSLVPGDEIQLYARNGQFKNPIAKVIYTGDEDGEKVLQSNVPLSLAEYDAMIVRSGYRNQLSVSAGSITSLQDPTKAGATKTYTKVIQIPAK